MFVKIILICKKNGEKFLNIPREEIHDEIQRKSYSSLIFIGIVFSQEEIEFMTLNKQIQFNLQKKITYNYFFILNAKLSFCHPTKIFLTQKCWYFIKILPCSCC
jgi:hypothetical protein